MERKRGYYFGTEVEGKWYRRYTKSGMLARGNGKYWYDDNNLYFIRTLTAHSIVIPFSSMYEIKTGSWHGGRWGQGCRVIKIGWSENNIKLSSGFVFTRNDVEALEIAELLKRKIKK